MGFVKAVFDRDVLIDFLQGVPEAQTEINRYSEPLYSVISWMEVMCGAESAQERQAADSLFKSMRLVGLSAQVAAKAVEEQTNSRLKLPDAMILASADCEGCILVTRNTKDFGKDDPRVRFPYSC